VTGDELTFCQGDPPPDLGPHGFAGGWVGGLGVTGFGTLAEGVAGGGAAMTFGFSTHMPFSQPPFSWVAASLPTGPV
jgi:hypothetical protein